ncbi:MAG: HAD family phosphatase [Acidimicrobiales bacterium]
MTGAPSGPIRAVVLDFGGVVVDWDMSALFREFFPRPDDLDRFLRDVLTPAENLRCDLGTPLATVVAELVEAHPHHRAPLEAWRDRWIETIPGEIEGTAELVSDLRTAGYPVLGLSNFSAETFPWCRERYPVFESFDDIVISGEVGVAKPQPEVYTLLCSRNGLEPHEAVFLDDSPTNVDGARAVGMASFLFTTVEQARADLRSIGVSA